MRFRKNHGVTMKVDENFYRMMEKIRYDLKAKRGIKIGSHTQLTNIISMNPKIFSEAQLMRTIKRHKL